MNARGLVNQNEVKLEDVYALKLGALWRSLKAQGFAFWALCACFFIEYVRPQEIMPALKLIPWGQLALGLTLVALMFEKPQQRLGNPQSKLMVVFVIVLLTSCVAAFDPSVAWSELKVFANWVILFFLVVAIVNSPQRLFLFLLLYLLWSYKLAQYGFITMAKRGFSFTEWGLAGPGSFLQNSGEYAIQMVIFTCMSAGFVLALRKHWKSLWLRLILYSMPLMGAVSVMGASSRGSQVALAVTALWVVLMSKQRIKALIAIGLMSYLLFLALPQEQIDRFRAAGEDTTSLQRLEYLDMGMETIAKHPVIGIGYANWLPYWLYLKPEGVGVLGKVQKPHNIYIQVGAELGLSGLTIFFVMVLVVFFMGSRTRALARENGDRFSEFIAYGLDASLIGYLVAGAFVTVFFYPFFWVNAALSTAVYSIARTRYAKRSHVRHLEPGHSSVAS